MKFLSLLFAVCTLSVSAETAILTVHFGSTHDDARSATSDIINKRVAEAFPEAKVKEAYTSRFVIKRLAERGMKYETPTEALKSLAEDGIDTVIVQPTFIIPGVEYDALLAEVDALRPSFKAVYTGTPLLYGVEECRQVADVLGTRHNETDMKHHVVFVGHGSPSLYTALYSQLDNMFKASGHSNFHVATIEGYPDMESVLAILKKSKARDVTLVPLLFLAGDHARNDIEKEWTSEFEKRGFTTNTWIEGLGEIPEIQILYIDRISKALSGSHVTSLDIKSDFIRKNNLTE